MTTWKTAHDTDFGSAPDTPAVGTGATLYDSLVDTYGGRFAIASGVLTGTADVGDAEPYTDEFLVQTAVSAGTTDQQAVAYTTGVFGYNNGPIVRWTSGNNCYAARFNNTAVDVLNITGGGFNGYVLTAQSYAGGAVNTAHTFKLSLSAVGTTITTSIYDITVSTLIGTWSATHTDLTAGQAGLVAGFGAASYSRLTVQVPDPVMTAPNAFASDDGTGLIQGNVSTVVGGTAPYTYQWYKSKTSGFTPGAGNIIAGQTNVTLVDTPLDGDLWYYKAIVTDTPGQTCTTKQLPVSKYSVPAAIDVWCVGDSIYSLTPADGVRTVPEAWANRIIETNGLRLVSAFNFAIAGTQSSDWLPGGTYYDSALSGFQGYHTAGRPVYVLLMLGTNDASSGVSAATFQARMTTIIADMISHGYVVLLNAPYYIVPGSSGGYTEASDALAQTYLPALDNIVAAFGASNPGMVIAGDRAAFAYFANRPGELVDGIHPNAQGVESLAYLESIPLIDYWRTNPQSLVLDEFLATATSTVTVLSRFGTGYPMNVPYKTIDVFVYPGMQVLHAPTIASLTALGLI